MATQLERRVRKLEGETGGSGRMLHVFALPPGRDSDRALDELGIGKSEDDLVVALVDPTGHDALPGEEPTHHYSKPF